MLYKALCSFVDAVNLLNQLMIPFADSSFAQPKYMLESTEQVTEPQHLRSCSTAGSPRTAKPWATRLKT